MPEQFREYRVYGPYVASDGRSRVILYKNKQKKTMSYPKFLWWKEKDILLEDHEQIHHKDEDFTNNDLNNFMVRTRYDHMHLHVKSETHNCVWCDKIIELKGLKLSRRKTHCALGKAGPFCSRKCTGEYGAEVQRSRK
jgi:hypothetical protein